MPGLNIRFSEAELAQLRESARIRGISMSALVHDTAVNYAALAIDDDRWVDSIARVTNLSRGLLDRLASL